MMSGDDKELFSDLQTLLLSASVRRRTKEGGLINTGSILKQSQRF